MLLFITYLSCIFLIRPLLEARAEKKIVGFLVQMKSFVTEFVIFYFYEVNQMV